MRQGWVFVFPVYCTDEHMGVPNFWPTGEQVRPRGRQVKFLEWVICVRYSRARFFWQLDTPYILLVSTAW